MKRILVVTIAMLLCFVTAAHGADPLDSRVQSDALIYIGWQGADALAAQYDQSNLKGVVENSKLKDYISENWGRWIGVQDPRELVGDPEKARDIADARQLGKSLWQHPSAFYFGPVTFAGKKPQFRAAIICDAGAEAPALAETVKRLIAKNLPPPELKVNVAQVDNLVKVGIGEIDALSFAGPKVVRLNDNRDYLAATKGMRKNPALVCYIDIQRILAAVTQVNQNSDESSEAKKKFAAALEALGLSSITQFAYTGSFDVRIPGQPDKMENPRFEWVEDAFIGIKGPRVGLLTLLDSEPVSDETLKLIPKNAVGFTAKRGNITKLLAEVRSVIKQVAPEETPNLEKALAVGNKFAGFDIEKDLLAALGDEWLVYRGHKADDMTSHPYVFVHKLRDPATFDKTLAAIEEKITALGGEKAKVEKLDTGTITVNGVRLPFLTVAWAVRNGHLFVSNLEGIAPAIEHVEKKGPSILENPSYLAVRKSLPDKKTSVVLFSEPAVLYPDTYQMIMGILPLARMGGGDFPADLFPQPKRVAPFLTPGGSICWTDDEGFHGSSRSATPGGELFAHQLFPTTLIAPLALASPVMLHSLPKARESAQRTADMARLHQIGLGCHTYAVENKDQMPEHLAQLVTGKFVSGTTIFVSARAGTKPLEITPETLKEAEKDFAAFSKKLNEHCDFIYIGNLGKAADVPFETIICYEKPRPGTDGIALLFLDGHCDFVKSSQIRDAFKATNEFRKKKGLPEIDAEALQKASTPNP